jgi:IS6 family transposase
VTASRRRCEAHKLSYRDLVEMMTECGLSLVHTTIMRWVHDNAPEFERC